MSKKNEVITAIDTVVTKGDDFLTKAKDFISCVEILLAAAATCLKAVLEKYAGNDKDANSYFINTNSAIL